MTGAPLKRPAPPITSRGSRRGATLVEVLIALFLVSAVCLSVFAGLSSGSKLALQTAIHGEAMRLMQDEAERLTAETFEEFVARGDSTVTSTINTTFLSGSQAQFAYPAAKSGTRVSFTRRVVETAAAGSSRTLRVEVDWTWQGKPYSVSSLLYRVE